MKRLLHAIAPAIMFLIATLHTDAVRSSGMPSLSHRLLQAPVPTDPIQALAVASALKQEHDMDADFGLRKYVRFRNLELLLGHHVPAQKVLDASRGPWSRDEAWFKAMHQFLVDSLVVDATRKDLPDAAWNVSPEATSRVTIAPGLWGDAAGGVGGRSFRDIWLAITVNNRLEIPLDVSLDVMVAGDSLSCGSLKIAPHSSVPALCKSVVVRDSTLAVETLLGFKEGADITTNIGATVSGGSPLRHVAIFKPAAPPTPEETAAIDNAAAALVASTTCEESRTCQPTLVDWATSNSGVSFVAVIGAMAICVFLRWRAWNDGCAVGWPMAYFFGYLAFLGLTVVIYMLEPSHSSSSQDPYGGLLFNLAKFVAGLPLSLAGAEQGPPNAGFSKDNSPIYIVAIFVNLLFLGFMTFAANNKPVERDERGLG